MSNAEQTPESPAKTPRFKETSCSQCGLGLGPGDSGVSHCENHVSPTEIAASLGPLQNEAVLGTVGAWTVEMREWMRANGLGSGHGAAFHRTDLGLEVATELRKG